MATFKVGQRVKYVSGILGWIPIGAEGTVLYADLLLQVDFAPHACRNGSDATVYLSSVVPLTDPLAESWALDKVKQVTKPQHTEPVAPRIKETA